MKKLDEITKSESVAYKGSFLEFKKEEVLLPDGNYAFREYIHHPGAVAILVIVIKSNATGRSISFVNKKIILKGLAK